MDEKNKQELIPAPIQADFLPVIPGIQKVADFIEFARWSATPSRLRQPKTQKAFADLIVVSQDSLTDWKHHPAFLVFVWGFMRERMQDQLPDTIDGLFKKLASGKGNASDLQLFIRLANLEPGKPDEKAR